MKQIPTPQLIRISDPALVPISDASQAIDTSNHCPETLWEEFLRLQLKPRTRQEYDKKIDYFCRFGVANAVRTRIGWAFARVSIFSRRVAWIGRRLCF
jgi:hypothetical protein